MEVPFKNQVFCKVWRSPVRKPLFLAAAAFGASTGFTTLRVYSAYGLLPTTYGLRPSSHCRLPTAYCLLPIAYCLLPTAYCLPTAYYLLPPAHCPLPIAYCLLPTAHCPLPTAHCSLPTAHCPLPGATPRGGRVKYQGQGQTHGQDKIRVLKAWFLYLLLEIAFKKQMFRKVWRARFGKHWFRNVV